MEGGDSSQLFPLTSSMSPFDLLLHVFSVIASNVLHNDNCDLTFFSVLIIRIFLFSH